MVVNISGQVDVLTREEQDFITWLRDQHSVWYYSGQRVATKAFVYDGKIEIHILYIGSEFEGLVNTVIVKNKEEFRKYFSDR